MNKVLAAVVDKKVARNGRQEESGVGLRSC
jgi:hypothetical protein